MQLRKPLGEALGPQPRPQELLPQQGHRALVSSGTPHTRRPCSLWGDVCWRPWSLQLWPRAALPGQQPCA